MPKVGLQEFFKGKTILITGGTGFMGKVLMEKILFSFSDVKEIFLLMRFRRDKNKQECLKDFLKSPAFHRIEDNSNVLSKITPIFGDVTKENLALSGEQLPLVLSSTSIVFHMAASLKFNAPLKFNIEANLIGTKNVLDMCKRMKNLSVVVHLSTAFCNCEQEVSDERVYDWPIKPNDLISCAEILSESLALKSFPNSYIFTKRMAEILVRDEFDTSKLNVCIVRPSLVTPAWREPMPGWVDSMNGIVGLLIASGKGFLRTMMADDSSLFQFIPVDEAIAGMITIAYTEGSKEKKSSDVSVYNVTSDLKMSIGFFFDELKRMTQIYPLEPGIWYPNGSFTMNPLKHYFMLIFTMWLPALAIDFLFLITCRPRYMIRIQKRIYAVLSVLQFFSTHNWIFETKKLKEAYASLSKSEREIFQIAENLKSEAKKKEYLRSTTLGIRKFCSKESPKSIARSIFYQRIQFMVDLFLKLILIKFFGGWLLGFLNFNKSLSTFITFVLMVFAIVNAFVERLNR